MKKVMFAVWLVLAAITTIHAEEAATAPDFWMLKGAEATPENRLDAVKNAGRALLNFAIYQPTDAPGAFPEEYQQKLRDAGYVFDFITEQQLSETVRFWTNNHTSPIGQFKLLVIPDKVSLPEEEIRRLENLNYAFLGHAPELLKSMNPEYFTSFADKKEEVEAEDARLEAEDEWQEMEDEEIETEDEEEEFWVYGLDQIGDNLIEGMGLLYGRERDLSENFVTKTGVKLLARRGCVTGRSEKAYFDDVFYVFANTKENAQPVNGWFRLQELQPGTWLGNRLGTDEDGNQWCQHYFAKNDRAFFMEPKTGKIGEASVRNHRTSSSNTMDIRIQMKPGETLVVRIVRERCDMYESLGYGEFESLPAWEYEGPEPPRQNIALPTFVYERITTEVDVPEKE